MSDSDAAPADLIRQRAYELWIQDGRPEGRDVEYWLRAESALSQDAATGLEGPSAGPPAWASRCRTISTFRRSRATVAASPPTVSGRIARICDAAPDPQEGRRLACGISECQVDAKRGHRCPGSRASLCPSCRQRSNVPGRSRDFCPLEFSTHARAAGSAVREARLGAGLGPDPVTASCRSRLPKALDQTNQLWAASDHHRRAATTCA